MHASRAAGREMSGAACSRVGLVTQIAQGWPNSWVQPRPLIRIASQKHCTKSHDSALGLCVTGLQAPKKAKPKSARVVKVRPHGGVWL
jgi:hypothetical protein